MPRRQKMHSRSERRNCLRLLALRPSHTLTMRPARSASLRCLALRKSAPNYPREGVRPEKRVYFSDAGERNTFHSKWVQCRSKLVLCVEDWKARKSNLRVAFCEKLYWPDRGLKSKDNPERWVAPGPAPDRPWGKSTRERGLPDGTRLAWIMPDQVSSA
jgi:hypothetical protein